MLSFPTIRSIVDAGDDPAEAFYNPPRFVEIWGGAMLVPPTERQAKVAQVQAQYVCEADEKAIVELCEPTMWRFAQLRLAWLCELLLDPVLVGELVSSHPLADATLDAVAQALDEDAAGAAAAAAA